MSDRPTPETERVKGALHTNWDDLLNHARRLERERDEAREAIVGWENKWKCAIEMAAKAEVDRDEARAEVDRYREKLDLSPIHWKV